MNKIKYILLSIFTMASFLSCSVDDNDELTGDATEGGLVKVGSPLVTYVVGSGKTYTATGKLNQGRETTNSISVYKSFTGNRDTGEVDEDGDPIIGSFSSNEVLLTTVDIDDMTSGSEVSFSLDFTYETLIKDLEFRGEPLPSNDGNLVIGDYWSLRYVSNLSDNKSNSNSNKTKIAVGTRYAGVYDTVESVYWNSGSEIGNWNGDERIIESVNATLYRHVGLAYWIDNEFFFTVDNTTGYIYISPEDLEGSAVLLNGSPIMTCEGGPGPFESISCNETTSVATPDDVDGEDMLEFTVGYHRGTGATREFYEKLVKK